MRRTSTTCFRRGARRLRTARATQRSRLLGRIPSLTASRIAIVSCMALQKQLRKSWREIYANLYNKFAGDLNRVMAQRKAFQACIIRCKLGDELYEEYSASPTA